uniref:Ig-like domain-containing protein n=1 Tax=Neogobius melanostomus TaxID=47308 RepID=A0A8C6UWQ8_9GOBI
PNMDEPVKLLLFLLLWQHVWMFEVPLEVKQPPTIIKQSMKEHIVDPKETMVIECEAKGNPSPIFSWRRNGKYFNVARDPQTSMRRRSGTLDIYAKYNPEQYEAEYQCIASNQYGSAYSNKIRLMLYSKEIQEPVVVSAGKPLVLPCDPPPGPPRPETYWMKSLPQDRRVSMGVSGDLYFSNVLFNDSVLRHRPLRPPPTTHTLTTFTRLPGVTKRSPIQVPTRPFPA